MKKHNLLYFGFIIVIFIPECKKENNKPKFCTTDTSNSKITIPLSTGEIIKHTYYTLSYSESNEQAEWVYYKLTSYMILGTHERTNDFRVDSAVSSGSAELTDYEGSDYDRGHLCPAGDMTISYTAMSESFYLSNMSPQDPLFNRGIWETLESIIRNFAKEENEIYVVTGPIFRNNKGVIGANRVTIPGFYYKIVYSPFNEKMIAFILPNAKGTNEIEDYIVTVDSIERLTNIDFFPHLSKNLQSRLEGKTEVNKWLLISLKNPVSELIPVQSECQSTSNCRYSEKIKNVGQNDTFIHR
jgi:endonuclease G, mitochondrial